MAVYTLEQLKLITCTISLRWHKCKDYNYYTIKMKYADHGGNLTTIIKPIEEEDKPYLVFKDLCIKELQGKNTIKLLLAL